MVGVAANEDSKSIVIAGHGLHIPQETEIDAGVYLSPVVPEINLDDTVHGCQNFHDYAAVVHGREITSFSIIVRNEGGGDSLVKKAWNALWLFHLLCVACRTPCVPLYSVSDGQEPRFVAANPSPFIRPFSKVHRATASELDWAKRHLAIFDNLIQVPEFSAAIRCYSGAQFLPEHDVRIMLLWSGIEGLLSVDAELSRRLALYAAILFDGSPEEKVAHFDKVKKAYAVRSRAVHGSGLKKSKLEEGYTTAGTILIGLIAKCVELGRVPSSSELDHLAVSATLL